MNIFKDGFCKEDSTCPDCPHEDNDYEDIIEPCKNFEYNQKIKEDNYDY